MDVFFDNFLQIEKFMRYLKKNGFILKVSKYANKTQYNNLFRVVSIRVGPMILIGPVYELKMDLVTKIEEDGPFQPVFPDFEANILQLTKGNIFGLFRDVHDRNEESNGTFPVNKVIENTMRMATIMKDIVAKKTKMIVYTKKKHDEIRHDSQMTVDDKVYDSYIYNLFRRRLPKMIMDGWSISNLLKSTTILGKSTRTQQMCVILDCDCFWSWKDGKIRDTEKPSIEIFCQLHGIWEELITDLVD
jgi:hypothetical protein